MRSLFGFVTLGLAGSACAGPWASMVISYDPGTNPAPGYSDPMTALGRPERFTGEGVFPGAVTPFNPAWKTDELVSIGEGGHLTVKFDKPIRNSKGNPFGIDLLIFGNTGYIDSAFPAGVVGGVFGSGGGLVEVSKDGVTWFMVPGAMADREFPTLGYLDLTSPYQTTKGLVPADFRKPVDPSFMANGKTFAEIAAAYDGSGGGSGIDIGVTGLRAISYVRVSSPLGSGVAAEVDAFSNVRAVPTPGVPGLLGFVGIASLRRGRRPQPTSQRLGRLSVRTNQVGGDER